MFQLNIISGNTEIIKNYWLSYDAHMPEWTVSGFQAVSLVKLASSKRTWISINLSACVYFFLQRTFKRYLAHTVYHHFFCQLSAMGFYLMNCIKEAALKHIYAIYEKIMLVKGTFDCLWNFGI